jgi:putative colanic acid biosynthesis UDP-glucose lipid carrier transferase
MVIDLVIIVLSLYSTFNQSEFPLTAVLFIGGIWLAANLFSLPTGNRRYISYVHTFYRVVQPFILFSLLYALVLELLYPNWKLDTHFIKYFAFLFLLLISGKALFVFALRVYRRLGFGYSRYIVVSDGEHGNKVKRMFNSRREGGFQFVAEWNWNSQLMMDTAGMTRFFESHNIDEVYVLQSEINESRLPELLKAANQTGVGVFLFPDKAIKYIRFYNFRYINHSTLNELKKGPLVRPVNAFRKRLFDLLFSIIVCVGLLSWILPLLAVLIKLDSKGPVFFFQKRAGKDGKMFTCLKLRTMRVNEHAHSSQAKPDDDRITKLGRILRATSLDELPQFLNVLWGTMSVVGPRPHIEMLNRKFEPEIADYHKRLWVKPGITGLSQTYGYRGLTEGVEQMKTRVNADVVYIMNWTLLLDIRIIWKTITGSFLFGDENAY